MPLPPVPFLFVAAALFGAVVGSFLNVVIARLPVMIGAAPRPPTSGEDAPSERFDLVGPPSTCPACGHRIRPWENVPVVSFLVLRGRCSACGTRIPVRYPLVEVAGAAVAVAAVVALGPTWPAVAAMGFGWSLVAVFFIDWDHQLIPDAISLPLLWAGLLVNAAGGFVEAGAAVVGAAAGYASLWLLYHGVRLASGREAMGYGDFKLFAAIGAWAGWQALPSVLFLASGVGAAVGLALMASGRLGRGQPVAFGPFLALAGLAVLLGRNLPWRFL